MSLIWYEVPLVGSKILRSNSSTQHEKIRGEWSFPLYAYEEIPIIQLERRLIAGKKGEVTRIRVQDIVTNLTTNFGLVIQTFVLGNN